MECPAKKRYRYDERLPTPKSPAADRGTEYHRIIESALGELTVPVPAELDFYAGYLARLRNLGAKAEHKFAVDRSWVPTEWDSPNAWVIGVADVWLPSVPTAHVQDWKTGKIYDDHHLQGEFYSVALLGSVPEAHEVRATFIYTDLHKEQNRTYSRDKLVGLRDRWTARVERMERDTDCVPTPHLGCRWCPYSKAKGGPCQF